MTDYSELVKALRWNGTEYKGSMMDEDDKQMYIDAADAIEALQTNVKRLKEANDELREAQTYIDNYGDKWLIRKATNDDNQIFVKIDAAPVWDSTTKYQPGTKVMYHGEEHIIGKTGEIETWTTTVTSG